jgi:hypothetical protein
MAARLLRIKAQMLLPRADEEQWEEPRGELVRRLLEYQQMREVVDILERRGEERRNQFARAYVPVSPEPPQAPLALSLAERELQRWLDNAPKIIAQVSVVANPSVPPKPQSVEGALLACCTNDLPANILVLGHHGSKTSSRKAFVSAVQATDYVVSSGPTPYGPVVLPDQEVLNLVQAMPKAHLWRTDENDPACKTSTTKIGPPDDGKPGGCNTVHIHIPGSATSYQVSVF